MNRCPWFCKLCAYISQKSQTKYKKKKVNRCLCLGLIKKWGTISPLHDYGVEWHPGLSIDFSFSLHL